MAESETKKVLKIKLSGCHFEPQRDSSGNLQFGTDGKILGAWDLNTIYTKEFSLPEEIVKADINTEDGEVPTTVHQRIYNAVEGLLWDGIIDCGKITPCKENYTPGEGSKLSIWALLTNVVPTAMTQIEIYWEVTTKIPVTPAV